MLNVLFTDVFSGSFMTDFFSIKLFFTLLLVAFEEVKTMWHTFYRTTYMHLQSRHDALRRYEHFFRMQVAIDWIEVIVWLFSSTFVNVFLPQTE